MKKVDSSHLDTIHFDKDTNTLHIKFTNGQTYHYYGINENDYKNFENAESHGKHFVKYIKNGYKSRKV